MSLDDTPYYHCVCRCVRRAFLCGRDFASGEDYEHRRQWIIDRLQTLSQVFTIDICAYAVMSNHYHLVLRIDRDQAQALNDDKVIERWNTLFKLPLLVERYRSGMVESKAEHVRVQEFIATWRDRLMDLSWFMRCLNEHIARQANEEDGCKGRFWEGRYKSQALLDEEAESLRTPDHLPFSFTDYLQLVDWSGRAVREDKRGYIPANLPPILTRLDIDPEAYLKTVRRGQRIDLAIGTMHSLRRLAEHLHQRYIRGSGEARRLFPLAT